MFRQLTEKSWLFTINYKGQILNYKIRLYSQSTNSIHYQLFAKNRVIYLRLDHQLNLVEEITHNQTPAPREFLDELQKVFREMIRG